MSRKQDELKRAKMEGIKLALQYVQAAKALREDPEKFVLELIAEQS